MRKFRLIGVILIMSLFILASCNKDDEEVVIPVLLDSFEMVSMPLTVNDAKLLLTQQPELSALAQKMEYGITVYKIKYKTLFKGDTILASGLIAAPIAIEKKEKFPVLSFQHGTISKKTEAPTVDINNIGSINGYMAYLASTGMVVIIPDYIGFGASSSEFHPYMHNQYTVNAVLDMIRASQEFIATEKPCEINDKLFLLGYSQGGSATIGALSAIENESKNSDIIVTATSAGSGAYNLLTLKEWIMKQPRYEQPYLIAYILESFTRYTDMEIDYSLVFDEKFAVTIPDLFDGVNDESYINYSFGTYHVGELFHDSFEDEEIFKTDSVYTSMIEAFNDNKISGWNLKSNLRLYHGSADDWITAGQTQKLSQEFQGSVKTTLLDGKDHSTAIIPTISASMEWFLTF